MFRLSDHPEILHGAFVISQPVFGFSFSHISRVQIGVAFQRLIPIVLRQFIISQEFLIGCFVDIPAVCGWFEYGHRPVFVPHQYPVPQVSDAADAGKTSDLFALPTEYVEQVAVFVIGEDPAVAVIGQ